MQFVDPEGLAPRGIDILFKELGVFLMDQGVIATSPAREVGMQCGRTLCSKGKPGGPSDRYFDGNVTEFCLSAVGRGQRDVAIGVLEECKSVCKKYIKDHCNPDVLGCFQ